MAAGGSPPSREGPQAFGALLQQHRLATGLSQEELAERAGLSRRGISDLERGLRQAPYPATIRRLAEALGLPASERAALLAASRQASPMPPTVEPAVLSPPAGPPAEARPAHNLPRQLTSLVGREDDVATLRRLLPASPLVTLTGAGGLGKTRLALRVAEAELPTFADGAWLVELGGLAAPRLVPAAVAETLNVLEQAGRALIDSLVERLGPRHLLLVLDNCEHLVEGCAELAEALLSACPDLRILATSREPLHTRAEVVWRVRSLAVPEPAQLPPPDELAAIPAVRLFVERAQAVRPEFRLTEDNVAAVAAICRQLEGLPLALELAAARLGVLSAGQVAGRLHDVFQVLGGGPRTVSGRQRTLRATLDWSSALLAEPERALFGRLAVFAGGFSVEAAEAVGAGEDLEPKCVLNLLSGLVDQSLVLAEEAGATMRYRLLEPIRQYAQEQLLEAREEQPARRRHAAFYVALAARAEPELHGPRQGAWRRQLDRELDNLRAAVRWAQAHGEVELVLRLAGALYWYLWTRGHLREGLGWIDGALAHEAAAASPSRGPALCTAALLLMSLGLHERSAACAGEALALARASGDATTETKALTLLAHDCLHRGDAPAARPLYEAALAAARAANWTTLEAHALTNLGQALRFAGEAEPALALYREALERFAAQGDGWGIAYAANNLAFVLQERGDYTEAARLSAESVRRLWEQGDQTYLAAALEDLARALGGQRRFETATRLFGAVHALRQAQGATLPPGGLPDYEQHLAAAREALGAQRFAAEWASGEALTPEEAVDCALTTEATPAGAPARTGRPTC